MWTTGNLNFTFVNMQSPLLRIMEHTANPAWLVLEVNCYRTDRMRYTVVPKTYIVNWSPVRRYYSFGASNRKTALLCHIPLGLCYCMNRPSPMNNCIDIRSFASNRHGTSSLPFGADASLCPPIHIDRTRCIFTVSSLMSDTTEWRSEQIFVPASVYCFWT